MRHIIMKAGLSVVLAMMAGSTVQAQDFSPAPNSQDAPLNRFYYYPYYYFPHNYWPSNGPKWPEPVGAPYMKPPAYMSYPAFIEPNWRHEWNTPQKYYRGFHFWLDQF